MYTYKQVNYPNGNLNTTLIKRSDNAYIPMDEANTDFVEYQKWLSEGNQPLPADTQGAA
jgi:hypothetical protein